MYWVFYGWCIISLNNIKVRVGSKREYVEGGFNVLWMFLFCFKNRIISWKKDIVISLSVM